MTEIKQDNSTAPEKDGQIMELDELSKMLPVPDEKRPQVSPLPPQPNPYPKGVAFIACTELGARFAYYGSRTVLTLYLRNVLEFSEDLATTVYHSFLLLCYCLPMIWGIAADSGLGMYNTIWIVNLLFLLGNGILTTSALPVFPVPLTILSLLLMAVATGGMKPCLAPFGGEQFNSRTQSLRLQQYFSIFFIATTIGNMAATVLTPVLRKDVSCLGAETCYPLAFGVPTAAMLFALVMFLAGKSFYKRKKSEGNMLTNVFNCVKHAIMMRKRAPEKKVIHWLDHAEGKFSPELISDIKGLLGLLIYYAPMPMFYALLEQLGSKWTLQATRMTGLVGGWHILPDQMQVSNAVFMLIFTPIFEYVVYPLAGRCSLLRRPLQRMGLGFFLAGLAFFVAGLVEIQIQNDQRSPNLGREIHIINGLPCNWNLTLGEQTSLILPPDEEIRVLVDENGWKITTEDTNCRKLSWTGNPEPGTFLLDTNNNGEFLLQNVSPGQSHLTKSKEGNPKLIVMFRPNREGELSNPLQYLLESTTNSSSPHTIEVYSDLNNTTQPSNDSEWIMSSVLELSPDIYILNSVQSPELPPLFHDTRRGIGGILYFQLKDGSLIPITYHGFEHISLSTRLRAQQVPTPHHDLRTGGVYLLLIDGTRVTTKKVVNIVPPNGISILWLLPQYMLMSWGQILFIVSGMEFSYTQAPPSMKSVLAALWNLMNAFGNVIVILSVSAQGYYTHSQSTEYFQFAGLMGLDVVFFSILAIRYKYVEDK